MNLDEKMDNYKSALASKEENTSSRNLNNYRGNEAKTQENVAAKSTEVNIYEGDNNNIINAYSHHYWDLVRKFLPSYQEKIEWLNANSSILV
jgi:hypothetical protein